MKIIGVITILTLLTMCGISTPLAAAEEVSVIINSASNEVNSGADFTATIEISGLVDLNAVQYDITFNPSVLRLDDITPGQINSKTIVAMFNEIRQGTYRVVQTMGLGAVSGSGSLAALQFHVIGSPGQKSTINLSNGVLVDINEVEIPATWGTKSVSVISEESGIPASTPSPTPGSTPKSTPPSVPSSSPPPSTEPEPEAASGTVAEVPSPAKLLPPAPGSKKADRVTHETKAEAEVAGLESAPEKVLPPAPEPAPVKQPWLWAVVGGVIVIIVLFIIIRLSRRPL